MELKKRRWLAAADPPEKTLDLGEVVVSRETAVDAYTHGDLTCHCKGDMGSCGVAIYNLMAAEQSQPRRLLRWLEIRIKLRVGKGGVSRR
ncbi:hypothetical protein TIFTF001_054617, partial [Ficus carica]